ncbi:hypothetical protein IU450_24890 [Nocardia abscessus]|uniref:hypothetical protein n=1 Tax=Nocardia abscessus TaxID=120957 RepID=UPI0018951BA9|nr:hypothetical protein [Nocardia abscessus]MBF6339105.1 hypothetical protein [Nocardia abscessus]
MSNRRPGLAKQVPKPQQSSSRDAKGRGHAAESDSILALALLWLAAPVQRFRSDSDVHHILRQRAWQQLIGTSQSAQQKLRY